MMARLEMVLFHFRLMCPLYHIHLNGAIYFTFSICCFIIEKGMSRHFINKGCCSAKYHIKPQQERTVICNIYSWYTNAYISRNQESICVIGCNIYIFLIIIKTVVSCRTLYSFCWKKIYWSSCSPLLWSSDFYNI